MLTYAVQALGAERQTINRWDMLCTFRCLTLVLVRFCMAALIVICAQLAAPSILRDSVRTTSCAVVVYKDSSVVL